MRRRVKLFLKSMRHHRRLEFIWIIHLRLDPILLRHRGTLIYRLLLELRLLELLLWRLIRRLINLHLILGHKALRRLHLLELWWLLGLRHPVLLKLLLLLRVIVLNLLHGGRCWFVHISVSIRGSCTCFSKWILKVIEFFSFSSFLFFLFEFLFHLLSLCFVLEFSQICLFICLVSTRLFKRMRRSFSRSKT